MQQESIRKDVYCAQSILGLRNELYGIAAMMVLILHLNMYVRLIPTTVFIGKVFLWISELGNIGVDIFLVLSAIGLSKSMEKHSLAAFYQNRFHRIGPVCIVAGVLFWSWYDLIYSGNGILMMLLNISTLSYWGVNLSYPLWYVSFIVVLYLIFPAIYYLDRKSGHLTTWGLLIISIAGGVIMHHVMPEVFPIYEKMISRSPIFLLSLMFAQTDLGCPISGRKVVLCVLVGGILSCALILGLIHNTMINRWIGGIVGVAIIVGYGWVRTENQFCIFGRAMKALGCISLEIYVVHVLLIQVIKAYSLWSAIPEALWFVLLPIVTYLLSVALNKISYKIIRK